MILARSVEACRSPGRRQTGDPPSPITPQTPNPSPLAATAITTAPLLLQASASDAKFADYKPKVAFFFPGQGAQSVGIAADVAAAVPAAKHLFERASDILGYDLLQVCAEGGCSHASVCVACLCLCGSLCASLWECGCGERGGS